MAQIERVLITGGCGFIGSNLVRFLRDRTPWKLTVLDDLRAGRAEYVTEDLAEIRVGSVSDPSHLDAALHGALSHSDLPFHKIVEAVQPPRDPSRTPLFQINFRAPQQPYPLLELNGVSASQVEVLDNGTAKFDLALEIGAFAGGSSYFEYCTDLLKEEKIVQMASDFRALLGDLIAHPDVPLSQLRKVAEISQRVRPQPARALR